MAEAQQEETEYYWDEASQTYYYWDEETQAYYPWVEETAAETENQEEPARDVPEETAEPDAEVVGTPAATGALTANPGALSSQVAAPAAEELVVPHGEQHAVERSQEAGAATAVPSAAPPGPRGLRRRLSFAQHGGLAGCIQIANAERLQRQDTSKLTDADIKLEQQKARIREMLLRTGLADETLLNRNARTPGDSDAQSSDLGDRRSLAAIDLQLHNPTRAGSGGDVLNESEEAMQRGLSLIGPGKAASVARDIFANRQQPKEREFRRRSTVRFGTSEFRDPVFQAKLEAMLGSSVKK